MIWICEIKYGVTQNNQQLFVFAYEYASEWMVLRFYNHALSRPLPELGLGGPELLGVAADNESRVLPLLCLFFPFFLFTHRTMSPLLVLSKLIEEPLGYRAHTSAKENYPKREAL